VSAPGNYLHCPLCGFEFVKQQTPCHQGCPLNKLCKLVCCPSCHYEFPPETRLTGWWRRLFGCREPAKPPGDLFSLRELDEGDHAELVRLTCEKVSRRNTLAVYGLVPGSRLVLQQKRPSFVVRVGETELALEADIAGELVVKRVASEGAGDVVCPHRRNPPPAAS
jgi:Fe2+ transport system protein FeoA